MNTGAVKHYQGAVAAGRQRQPWPVERSAATLYDIPPMPHPRIYVIAGSNGAGKTTSAIKACIIRSMIARATKSRSKLSPVVRMSIRAMRRGIRLAAEQSRRDGIPMAIWKNGRVALIRP
jgi:hypothetical protein